MEPDVFVFLDFDGVLNNSLSWDFERDPAKHGSSFLDHRAVKAFSRFMRDTPNARLVISSVWRLYYSEEELDKIMESFGYDGPKIWAYTESNNACSSRVEGRVSEIQSYIKFN